MDCEKYLNVLEEVGEEWYESEIRTLIMHIKANELLFNKANKDFWNKEKKDNAWKIIAMILNKTEIEVQKRWKSLRTVFSRKLAQLKQKMPSGSGANTTRESFEIEWEYWGDMQFLIPHMRHKSNRTSNFSNKPFPVSLETSESLISSATTGNSLLKPVKETCKDAVAYTLIKSLPLQDSNSVLSGTSTGSVSFVTETPDNEIALQCSDQCADDSLHFEALSASSSEQEISVSINKAENKKHASSIKYKRKVPTPDAFHTKKKKELESCTARMSETSQYMKETLNVLTQSLKEPSGNDDLQYFACLLPIFNKLNDNQKTECLKALLNVMIEFGNKSKS